VLQENRRGDHGTIGSPDEPERMWVSVPSGSIDESMSAVSDEDPTECLVNEELLCRSAD